MQADDSNADADNSEFLVADNVRKSLIANDRTIDPHRSVSGYLDSPGDHVTNSDSSSMQNVMSTVDGGPESIEIVVEKPEKIVTPLDTFVLFQISMKTERNDYAVKSAVVKRRFSDFAWLRQQLEADHPMLLIPALPEKHNLYALDRYDRDFIRHRCRSLHGFLLRLCQHPSLAKHDTLKSFLILSAQDWAKYRKKNLSLKNGLDALHSIASQYFAHGTANAEFDHHLLYLSELSQRLLSVETALQKLHRFDEELTEETMHCQSLFNSWSESEPSGSLKLALLAVTDALDDSATAFEILKQTHVPCLQLPLHEWRQNADAAKAVFKRRDQVENERNYVQDALSLKRTELDTLESVSEPEKPGWFGASAETRRQKLKDQIEEHESKLAECEHRLDQSNSEIRVDLVRWKELKDRDMSKVLANMAQCQLEYHKQCVSAWEKAIVKINTEMGDIEITSAEPGCDQT